MSIPIILTEIYKSVADTAYWADRAGLVSQKPLLLNWQKVSSVAPFEGSREPGKGYVGATSTVKVGSNIHHVAESVEQIRDIVRNEIKLMAQ